MPLLSKVGLDTNEERDRQQSPTPQSKRCSFLRKTIRRRISIGPTAGEKSLMENPPRRSSSVTEPYQRSSLANRRRTTSDSIRPRDVTVRFREPEDEDYVQSRPPSDDEESLAGSELSDQTDASIRRKKQKRIPRKSTRFALGFPAPQMRTKRRSFLQIRPRVLLQLQQLGERRAMPAFDVVPSSLISGSLIIPKLSKRFPRMFRARPYLGPNGLLVVRSEHYNSQTSPTSSDESDEDLDDRDVLAVVGTSSEQDDDFVEIVFQDGSTWITSLMANGSYEFTSITDGGDIIRARWVKRRIASPRASWGSAEANAPQSSALPPPEYKWTFSVIDPSTRRHPIQGVLTSTTLDIFDTYSVLSTSSSSHPPPARMQSAGSDSEQMSGSPGHSSEGDSAGTERVTMTVTEENKKLMLATAIWISVRQKGWPGPGSPRLVKAKSSRNMSKGTNGKGLPVVPTSCPLGGPGTSAPAVPADDCTASLQDASANLRPDHESTHKRAVSSGSQFMRKRREASETAEPATDETQKTKPNAEVDTPSCRRRVRRFTYNLFHPSSQRVW